MTRNCMGELYSRVSSEGKSPSIKCFGPGITLTFFKPDVGKLQPVGLFQCPPNEKLTFLFF